MILPTTTCALCEGLGEVEVNRFVDTATRRKITCHICRGKGTLPPTLDDAMAYIATLESKLEAAEKCSGCGQQSPPCPTCDDYVPRSVLVSMELEKTDLESKLQAVFEYAGYRKDNSPCCRDILKLLTGDSRT